jgi:hypothetical protein
MTSPTLLNSCAYAATAAEARFRITGRPRVQRATRVIALDAGAGDVVRRLAAMPWPGVRFLCYEPDGRERAELVLTRVDGQQVWLCGELADADFAMMVATDDDGAAVAAAIGEACTKRGIMTAGLIVGDGSQARAAVAALRPYARVLLTSPDEDDAEAMLSAVG